MTAKKILVSLLVSAGLVLVSASGAGGEALTLPISGKLVHGTLTWTDGEEIKFTVLEGAMLTVRDESTGRHFGFTPTIEDEAEQLVRFKIFEIREMGSDLQSLKLVDDVVVPKALEVGSASLPATSQLTVRGISDSGLSEADVQKMREEYRVKPNLGPTDTPSR